MVSHVKRLGMPKGCPWFCRVPPVCLQGQQSCHCDLRFPSPRGLTFWWGPLWSALSPPFSPKSPRLFPLQGSSSHTCKGTERHHFACPRGSEHWAPAGIGKVSALRKFSSMRWSRMKFRFRFFCTRSGDFGQGPQPVSQCLIINKMNMVSFQ